jgi:hypothetical protein
MRFNSHRLFTALTAVVLAMFTAATAQQLTWSLDMGSAFDNREGSSDYAPDQTIFFTSVAPEVGAKFGKHDRIAGGVVWTNPIGNEWEDAKVSPTLYYRHTTRRWNATMGMLPRTLLHEQLPNFLWNDSLSYYQRNIRGVLLQYHSRTAFVDFYLDWRQLQTETKREAFNIMFHGQWRPKARSFMVGAHLLMNHYALVKNAPDDQHIVDNFMVNPYVGVDLSGATALDSLSFRLGALATIERNRAYDEWKTPVGGWFEAVGEWKWLGVKNTLYVGGDGLLPSYGEHANNLYQAEPYYQSKYYDRADIYAYIVRNQWVNFQASLDFNITNSGMMFYQRLLLRVYLDQFNCQFNKKHHKKAKKPGLVKSLYL